MNKQNDLSLNEGFHSINAFIKSSSVWRICGLGLAIARQAIAYFCIFCIILINLTSDFSHMHSGKVASSC